MAASKTRVSQDAKRIEFKIRLPRKLGDDIRARARRAKMFYSRYVEYVLENAKHPDPSRVEIINALKKINQDQARLGNLLNSGLVDPEFKANHEQMHKLLGEVRETQKVLKAKVLSV